MKQSEKSTNFPALYSISEYDVISNLLENKNDFLKNVLEDSINQIKNYFNSIVKENKIGICLQRDPEDPSFEIYLILINTEIRDYDERNIIEDKICEIIEEITQYYYNIAKGINKIEHINEIKRKITFLVDNLKND